MRLVEEKYQDILGRNQGRAVDGQSKTHLQVRSELPVLIGEPESLQDPVCGIFTPVNSIHGRPLIRSIKLILVRNRRLLSLSAQSGLTFALACDVQLQVSTN